MVSSLFSCVRHYVDGREGKANGEGGNAVQADYILGGEQDIGAVTMQGRVRVKSARGGRIRRCHVEIMS